MATNLTCDTLSWLKMDFQRKIFKMGRFRRALFYGVSRLKWIADDMKEAPTFINNNKNKTPESNMSLDF